MSSVSGDLKIPYTYRPDFTFSTFFSLMKIGIFPNYNDVHPYLIQAGVNSITLKGIKNSKTAVNFDQNVIGLSR